MGTSHFKAWCYKVTPFELVYGQEVMLPVEVNLDSYRLAKQNDLSAIVYH